MKKKKEKVELPKLDIDVLKPFLKKKPQRVYQDRGKWEIIRNNFYENLTTH
jgi:hypothetical protein